jgi:hypothetical protein
LVDCRVRSLNDLDGVVIERIQIAARGLIWRVSLVPLLGLSLEHPRVRSLWPGFISMYETGDG